MCSLHNRRTCIGEVLWCILYIKLPTWNTRLHELILNDEGFYPYFKDCVRAINGTHILAFVREDERAPFCNRKGTISQNVLAACSFDLKFVYVLPGWEGSTSDSVVYQATRETSFQIPEGKYYLADAGYPNTDGLLAPYRGVRYHLREWSNSRDRCDYLSSNSAYLYIIDCQAARL